jgi:hypothetical protein
VGNTQGINRYSGFSDNGEDYILRYYSNPLGFGDSSRVKFPKKLTPTLICEGVVDVDVKWAYDFTNDYKTSSFTVRSTGSAYFGSSEFNIGEFSAGAAQITTKRINANGSGNLVNVGLEASINGASLSLQEFNIQATIGRVY